MAKRVMQSPAAWALALSMILIAPAAGPASGQSAPSFLVAVSPDPPIAGQPVNITITPVNFSLASTTFSWSRGSAPLKAESGIGKNVLVVATDPDAVTPIAIRVLIDAGPEFAPAEQALTITPLPNPAAETEALVADIQSSFTLAASPVSPDAGETVSFEVRTFSFDKDRASYQWHVNGAADRATSGRGRYRFDAPAPAEGASKTVRVDVVTPAGQAQSRSITVRTVSAPLYWWADTTVPYWYKGKALPSLGARVNVIALPSVGSASAHSYRWQFNGAVLATASGVGRQTFAFTPELPVTEEVDVTIRDAAGTFEKTVTTAITPASPAIGIYEVRPLRGAVYERVITEFSAPAGDPYDFIAIPFFFPRATGLRYRWALNGREITGAFDRPWLFRLESERGAASVNQLRTDVSLPIKGGEQGSAFITVNLH